MEGFSKLPIRTWAAKLSRRGGRFTKSTFEDLPAALLWLRVLIAFGCGLFSGLAPLTGWSGFLLFGVFSVGFVMLLLGPAYLDVDFQDFNQQELLGQGLMPAFAVFLVSA